jgi:8-oxo-dGTP pyrophosphatase MutT (NUDIX family)
VNAALSHTLLTLHAGLGCWLQLGGHCDGVRDPKAVALREAQEESGLTKVAFASPDVFDIDIHVIPTSSRTPEHLHYDIRYLMVADMTQPLRLTEESRDLAWVPLSRLEAYTDKPSVLVIKRKLELT